MLSKELSIIYHFTLANMKTRYRNTIAGFFWVILNPIILFSAQALVFKHILKIDMPRYYLFLLSGLLPWNFLSSSIEMGVPILDSSREILKGYKVKPFTLVSAQVLDNFFNFLFAFILILLPFAFFDVGIEISFLLLPISLTLFFVAVLLFTSILATLNIMLRDMKFISTFVLNIMFFLTPIFYPKEFIPLKFQFLVDYNPIYIFIELIRMTIVNFHPQLYLQLLTKAVFLTILLLLVRHFNWKKIRNTFYLNL